MTKPFLIIQLRPEDEAADDEFRAILRYGGLRDDEVVRARVEHTGLPEIELRDYSAIIVGGSPFDLSTPQHEKSEIQIRIEADFKRLFDEVVAADIPFLGACSGCGLLGTYLDTPISRRFGEPVGGTRVELTEAGRDFWAVVREPYLSHELARDDVRRLVRRGLEETGGSYKQLAQIFNVGSQYKKFHAFLKNSGCHIALDEIRRSQEESSQD